MTTLSRRRLLQAAGLAGGALFLSGPSRAALRLNSSDLSSHPGTDGPQTGFETRYGASWTTHDEELQFLEEVARRSSRVRLETIGSTKQGRPLHLVTLGFPGPRSLDTVRAGAITMFVCSQHGNEPAGRETGLKLLRDLAFTQDPVLLRQLQDQTVLVVPSANPDGRERNTRGNSDGVDINRDHLNLTTREARAMHTVFRDYHPDLVLDLHEYGPSLPVLYDDEILYLWPRNLNVDAAVRDLSRTACREYIHKGAEAAGYSADEYGLQKIESIQVAQTAGDEDEGICRNAMGLRHSLGILVESAVSADARNGVAEITDGPTLNRRRVASQRQVASDALRFMRDQGEVVQFATSTAPGRKAKEGAERSAPVFFYGADNDPPEAEQIQDPPPVAYDLTTAQAGNLAGVFALHGITTVTLAGGTVRVPMAQAAEPVIPLLLDGRARRSAVAGKMVES